MPEPNEILHAWEDEGALMMDLRGAMHRALQELNDTSTDLVADAEIFQWSLRDGRGQQLTYPIHLVSRTTYEEYKTIGGKTRVMRPGDSVRPNDEAPA